MLSLLPYVARYWKYVVLVLLVVGAYFYWSGRTNTIKEQAQEIINLKAEIQIQNDAQTKLRAGVDEQNLAIEKMKSRKVAIDSQLNNARHDAANIAQKYGDEINNILKQHPKDCVESINFLRNEAIKK